MSFHLSKKMEACESISWKDNLQSAYVNWKDYIPLPSGMVLPNRDWRDSTSKHDLISDNFSTDSASSNHKKFQPKNCMFVYLLRCRDMHCSCF